MRLAVVKRHLQYSDSRMLYHLSQPISASPRSVSGVGFHRQETHTQTLRMHIRSLVEDLTDLLGLSAVVRIH